MNDLGKFLFEMHWQTLQELYPNEDFTIKEDWDNSDETVKEAWRMTAQKFMQLMYDN